MKRKSLKRSSYGRRVKESKMKESLASTLQVQVGQLQQVSLFSIRNQSSSSTCSNLSLFQQVLGSEPSESNPPTTSAEVADVVDPNVDFILSQDFFW